MDKPKIVRMENGHFGDGRNPYPTVVVISSDGKQFSIEFAEWCIKYLNDEVIEKMIFILRDAAYRIRPDLRKM